MRPSSTFSPGRSLRLGECLDRRGGIAVELRMLDLAVIDSVEPDRVAAELVAALRRAHARDRDQHAAALGLEKLLRIRTDRVEVGQELADHLLESVRAGVGPAPWQALRDDDLGRVA